MNTDPVCFFHEAKLGPGSLAAGCAHWSSIHSIERETGHPSSAIRACHLQAAVSLRPQSILVRLEIGYVASISCPAEPQFVRGDDSLNIVLAPEQKFMNLTNFTVKLMSGQEYGYAPSVYPEISSRRITKTSRPTLFLPNFIRPTPQSNTV